MSFFFQGSYDASGAGLLALQEDFRCLVSSTRQIVSNISSNSEELDGLVALHFQSFLHRHSHFFSNRPQHKIDFQQCFFHNTLGILRSVPFSRHHPPSPLHAILHFSSIRCTLIILRFNLSPSNRLAGTHHLQQYASVELVCSFVSSHRSSFMPTCTSLLRFSGDNPHVGGWAFT